MLSAKRWQASTALVMSVGVIASQAAFLIFLPRASAASESYQIAQVLRRPQLFSQTARVPTGTVLPVRYDEAEKIVVSPEETVPVTLTLAANVRSSSGLLLIPAGSQIEGELRPVNGGTQFFAQELILADSGESYFINATSDVITETETIRKGGRAGDILKGAAIGGAAAAIIAELTGDIDVGEVLGGAGAGALGGLILGRRRKAEVIVINPDDDLDITLQSDLVLASVS